MQLAGRRHLGVALGAVGQRWRQLESDGLADAHAQQREVPSRHHRRSARAHAQRHALRRRVEHSPFGAAQPAGVAHRDRLAGTYAHAALDCAGPGEAQAQADEGLQRVGHVQVRTASYFHPSQARPAR